MPTRIGVRIHTPRKHPRQLRSRETVDAVVEAAAQVFEREGLTATTNRIAERTAAMLVHAADAQVHRVLLGREDGAGDLTRALLAMAG